mmetsp:Transcript_78022/g.178496  ORF Transcript_78022/g.178496 Transcript_78022/m.178496 type:complete len:229 (+) Transcript_78022:3-689(+)
MPRSPTLEPQGMLRGMDYVGTVSFGFSGGGLAALSGMDLLGTCGVGTLTALGGGTIRDALMLGKAPFWTEETEYVTMAVVSAAAAFAAIHYQDLDDKEAAALMDHPAVAITDTLGVAAFCIIGANGALKMAMPGGVAILCGISTATFGGMCRDVLCRRPVRILHSRAELYATCAMAGAATFTAATAMALPGGATTSMFIAFAVACAARTAASMFDLKLPTVRPIRVAP